MEIDLANLPEEGMQVSGAVEGDVFELSDDSIIEVSPLSYDLHVQRFDNELLFRGSLSAIFKLTCMRTLHPFQKTIRNEAVAFSIEITGDEELDVIGAMREEILILLPTNPLCDEGDEAQSCEINSKYLAVDKLVEDGVETSPASQDDSRWSALDAFSPGEKAPSDTIDS